MRIYTTNPSPSMTRNDYNANWRVMCILRGCEDPGDYAENCKNCGWNRTEERRRRYIPLTKNKDGLWHKNIRRENNDR